MMDTLESEDARATAGWHTELLQAPPKQSCPQEPQLLASLEKSLHKPEQKVIPVPQGGLHAVPAALQPVGGQDVGVGDEHVPLEHVSWPFKLPLKQVGPEPHETTGDDGLFPLSTHTELPVAQEIVPVLQRLVGWQGLSWAQVMQLPPTQTLRR